MSLETCLLFEINSLIRILGNSSKRTGGYCGFWSRNPHIGPEIKVFPCIFPVEQGIRYRDWFAADCTIRQPVARGRDFVG